jgi:hypothetical protein
LTLDLSDEETRARLNVLVEAIEADLYPLSPRDQRLRGILAKFGALGLAADLAERLRRYGPPTPARPPRPEERPPRQGRPPR